MKKLFYFVSIALLSFATSCTDTDLENSGPNYPVGENEVSFGAGEGAFNTGEKSSKKVSTRTIYEVAPGKKFDTYTELIVSWLENDAVRIYSPEAPTGYQTADYKVKPTPTTTEGKYGKDGYLEKAAPSGIHWSTTAQKQHFYAFYPGDDTHLTDHQNNLKTNSKVTFNLPNIQRNGIKVSFDSNGNSIDSLKGEWKVISADMTQCCMVADATIDVNTKNLVQLNFKPLMTVLDVVVTGSKIHAYDILGVRVTSKTQDIVGSFTYDFTQPIENRITFNDSPTRVNKSSYIDCTSENKPLRLGPGHNLNVKFFLLPRDINANELTIEVLCEGGHVLRKSLNNNTNLISGQVIKIRTPQIKLGEVSNWMSIIDDNVYFASQLSLPGAKHAYSFTTLGKNGNVDPNGAQTGMGITPDLVYNIPTYNTETGIMPFYQVMSIKDLFNSGVRAFDVKVSNDTGNGNALIYVAEQATEITLIDFLTELHKMVKGDGTNKPTECAVVNINFAYHNNSSQVDWLKKIQQDLNTFDATGSSLCKITSETTMGEMRGKIGIIVNYGGDKNQLPAITAPISVLLDYSTSVQNTYLNTLTFGNGKVHLQNLEQVNNPKITASTIDGVRPTVGLCPHYILRENILKNTSLDLIQKKKDLISKLITTSQTTASTTTDFYMNDLSGFCVVNDNQSTGWQNYATFEWDDGWLGINRGWHTVRGQVYNDVRDPLHHKIDITQVTERPTAPIDKQRYFGENGGAPALGQGGNTALFAQEINKYALSHIYKTVNDARAPLGIVYMSFAGVRTLHVGDSIYNVNGVALPSIIMANNFKFPLKKKPSTTPAQ